MEVPESLKVPNLWDVSNSSSALRSVKDWSERCVALSFFIFVSPVLLMIASAVKLNSSGPIIYSQERVGLRGRRFQIYKFRTMVENAESSTGPILSSTSDQRVTTVGAILRKTHLDELLQLVNIIKGDMSFLGPRPERGVFVKKYEKEIRGYENRHLVRPGVTGLAQILLPYDATAEQKLRYDLQFIAQRGKISIKVHIIWATAKKMAKALI